MMRLVMRLVLAVALVAASVVVVGNGVGAISRAGASSGVPIPAPAYVATDLGPCWCGSRLAISHNGAWVLIPGRIRGWRGVDAQSLASRRGRPD
jgi:hypothetical protein